MDLLMAPVPFFNKNMAVDAYYLRYQKGNDLLNSIRYTSTYYEGTTLSPALEMLASLGVEPFAMDQPLFVPINSLMLLGNLDTQCGQQPEQIVFTLEDLFQPDDLLYLEGMRRLRGLGFRFACKNLPINLLSYYAPLLKLCDYLLLNMRTVNAAGLPPLRNQIRKEFPGLQLVATHIDTVELFSQIKSPGIAMYEGRFYRLPVTKGQKEVSPLKANLIRLINIVQDENFEFETVSNIVQRDTALTIALMKLVNSPYIGRTHKISNINQAVTLLGQDEVRKWVTTSVTRFLGADKPNELTRISLLRAKFAENLAPYVGLQEQSQSLFLMGLFSILDVILDLPMEEAMDMVMVSDEIRSALVNRTGPFYPVRELVSYYETADWPQVSRIAILHDLNITNIAGAYLDAMSWYASLLQEEAATV